VNLDNVVAIAAGDSHSLALKTNGTVVAWGADSAGQCDVPVNLDNVVAIAAGDSHSLALKNDGTVVAWGGNDDLQSVVPANLEHVIAIAASKNHSLALKEDATIVEWGWPSSNKFTWSHPVIALVHPTETAVGTGLDEDSRPAKRQRA
jgi:alpha-tubulin suppressor-like RCC1 family protein